MAGRSRLGDNNSSSHTQRPPEPTQLGIGLAHRRARAQGEMILRSENPLFSADREVPIGAVSNMIVSERKLLIGASN